MCKKNRRSLHDLIPVSGLASGGLRIVSTFTGCPSALIVETPSTSAAVWQKDPLLQLPLSLRRMNLLGPWAPHSLPLAVRAPMTLCRSAVLGMTTTWVSDMEGWFMMRIPSGKHRLTSGFVDSSEPDAANWLCVPAAVVASFCWKGSFLLLRIRGLLGLRLMVSGSLKSRLFFTGILYKANAQYS